MMDNKKYVAPSESIIRDVLVRVYPVRLDLALQRWNAAFATEDQSLAIDGKTMRNAVDETERQTHIMSVVDHETALCITQKKVDTVAVEGGDEAKQTNKIGTFIPLLDNIDIQGKGITADALLTQRKLVSFVVER